MRRSVHALALAVTVSATAATVGHTAPAAAAPAGPAWCSAIGKRSLQGHSLKGSLESQDPRQALAAIVGGLCDPGPEEAPRIADIEAARRAWLARLTMTEADWPDAVEFALLDHGARMNSDLPHRTDDSSPDPARRAWSALDPFDQHAMFVRPVGASGALSLDRYYLADALGPRLSELGRVAFVRACIAGNQGPVDWAMCQGDVDRLDLAKALGEVRASKRDGADKMRARIAIFDLRPLLAAHAPKVAKLIASDPGYAKLFAIAKAAREDWDARASADAGLLELVGAMDDARTTDKASAFAGCEDTTWAAWQAAVAGVPAKKFEGMRDDRERAVRFIDPAMGPIIGHPQAYLASVALVTCMTVGQERGARPDILIRTLGEALSRWPGFRGPRTATETQILQAGVKLDDRDAKLEYPRVDRPFNPPGGGVSGGGGAGVVAKLTPGGKQTTVEFKKQLVKQVQCAETKETSRVVQIRSDGSFIYAITCVRNETVVVDKADSAQRVNPRYLAGVRPGMYVSVIEDVAVAAWAKPGASTPSHVFGVELK